MPAIANPGSVDSSENHHCRTDATSSSRSALVRFLADCKLPAVEQRTSK